MYACTSNDLPTIDVNDTPMTDCNTGFTAGEFTVSLSHAFAQPGTVRYRLDQGTAKRGVDWVPCDGLDERTLVTPALSISGAVPLRIKGDTLVEPDETSFINLREPVNGVIGRGTGTAMIVNDDIR